MDLDITKQYNFRNEPNQHELYEQWDQKMNEAFPASLIHYDLQTYAGDSSVTKLYMAMESLCVYDGPKRYNNMAQAAKELHKLASLFEKTNRSLYESYSLAASNCEKIDGKVVTLMSQISKAIAKYYNDTLLGEQKLLSDLNTFNNSMNGISSQFDNLGF